VFWEFWEYFIFSRRKNYEDSNRCFNKIYKILVGYINMKKGLVIFLFIAFLFSFVAADFSVDEFDVEEIYTPYELISGSINLTLDDEILDNLFTTNIDDKTISLREFLDLNKASKSCTPSDCSNDFSFYEPAKKKNFSVDSDGTWFGFVVEGDIRDIQDIEFSVFSDFGPSETIPLELQFFDDENFNWKFDKASDIFGDRNWSCYNASAEQTIGDITQNMYCEKFYLNEIPAMRIGGDIIVGDGEGEVEMKVYDSFGQEKDKCSFDPHYDDSCIASKGIFNGEYAICIRSDGDKGYDIKTETSGKNCGYLGKPSTADSRRDYAIFVRPALYSGAEKTSVKSSKDFNLVLNSEFYLYNKYSKNCEDGCVIPVFAKGVKQDLEISDVVLKYLTSDLAVTTSDVYSVEIKPGVVDFSGKLDLGLLGFDVGGPGKKEFVLSLGGKKVVEKDIEVLPAPVIKDVYPKNVPAGVLTSFIADVESDYNITSYVWSFGDGSKEVSQVNIVSHSYNKLGSYSLTLNVTDSQNLTSSKKFNILVGSPKEVLDSVFSEEEDYLNDTLKDIDKFSDWQEDSLKQILEIEKIKEDLSILKKRKSDATNDSEFLEIALALQNLDIPRKIFVSRTVDSVLVPDLDIIKPGIIAGVSGGSVGNFAEKYKQQIAAWQLENIAGGFNLQEVSVVRGSGREVLAAIYNFSFNSSDDAYFVIEKPRNELVFSKSLKFENDSSTIFSISKGRNNFEFLSSGGEADFFISPALSYFMVGLEIGPCNFNGICEPGENSSNCRHDCKPIGKAIFYVILSFIVLLIIYTFVQVWYMLRYENYLFKDRRHLFNLLNFVKNARNKGWDDTKIRRVLREQKWNGEQIVYVLKKSRGERTGLPEIIPISKLIDYYGKKRAKKSATENIGQNMGKFNKQRIQGI